MIKMIGFVLTVQLLFIIHMATVQSVEVLDIIECRACFSALAPGCKEKMSSADTNSSNAAAAMRDCMCTKQYFNAFTACGACSAKSMNSNILPDQASLENLKISCAAIGTNIDQNLSTGAGTAGNGSIGASVNNGNSGQAQNGNGNSNSYDNNYGNSMNNRRSNSNIKLKSSFYSLIFPLCLLITYFC
ncbi:hypothetical protein K7432_005453 [Basidiobolus ranarum]|uniref:Uncharacterized protein n=1 Tax=Basidiobolus ranarum TaxID=34480 RepID=A0ABR2WWG0_9FUNG